MPMDRLWTAAQQAFKNLYLEGNIEVIAVTDEKKRPKMNLVEMSQAVIE